MPKERLAAQMAALQLRFLDQLPDRLRQLEEALARDDGSAKAARVLIHRLVGAGAAFGCPDVSEAARRMEALLFPTGNANAHFAPDSRARIPELLATLKLAAHKTLARCDVTDPARPLAPPTSHVSEES